MIELLPCPFCGGEGEGQDKSYGMAGSPGWYVFVRCKNCHAESKQTFVMTDEDVSLALETTWNRRV